MSRSASTGSSRPSSPSGRNAPPRHPIIDGVGRHTSLLSLEVPKARVRLVDVNDRDAQVMAVIAALVGQIAGDRECTTSVLRALVRNVDVVGLEHVPAASRPAPHGLAPVESPDLRLRGAR